MARSGRIEATGCEWVVISATSVSIRREIPDCHAARSGGPSSPRVGRYDAASMTTGPDEATPIRFELRRGAVTALPLAVAVGLFGVSFGVLSATTGGMGALPAVVMSATTFAGSA